MVNDTKLLIKREKERERETCVHCLTDCTGGLTTEPHIQVQILWTVDKLILAHLLMQVFF